MSKKLAILINSLVAVVSGGAVALVTYFEPTNAAIINSAIDVASGANASRKSSWRPRIWYAKKYDSV